MTLPVFTDQEKQIAHRLLALKVAHMMGRKLEEGDWSEVYCKAKSIPEQRWSNLDIDVTHQNLGVEHKMLRYSARSDLEAACGTRLMHPSATRSIRIPDVSKPANDVMRSVFEQYAQLVEVRTRKVAKQNRTDLPVDMRTGWLLWQSSLEQFLYFEEPMTAPAPEQYWAEWRETSPARGTRKASVNLWIYERETGQKRFSVTTSAGIKLQPYFDVPPPSDPYLYRFTVIGERLLGSSDVRVWVTRKTAQQFSQVAGGLEFDRLNDLILSATTEIEAVDKSGGTMEEPEEAVPLVISGEAYGRLKATLPSLNDEHGFRLLLDFLSTR